MTQRYLSVEDKCCIFRDETVRGTLILTLTLHRQSVQVRVQMVVCIYVAPACSVYKPAFAQTHRGPVTPDCTGGGDGNRKDVQFCRTVTSVRLAAEQLCVPSEDKHRNKALTCFPCYENARFFALSALPLCSFIGQSVNNLRQSSVG